MKSKIVIHEIRVKIYFREGKLSGVKIVEKKWAVPYLLIPIGSLNINLDLWRAVNHFLSGIITGKIVY